MVDDRGSDLGRQSVVGIANTLKDSEAAMESNSLSDTFGTVGWFAVADTQIAAALRAIIGPVHYQ
jgi:hypothetical protein